MNVISFLSFLRHSRALPADAAVDYNYKQNVIMSVIIKQIIFVQIHFWNGCHAMTLFFGDCFL